MLEFQIPSAHSKGIMGRGQRLLNTLHVKGANAFDLYRTAKHASPQVNLIHVLYGEMDLPLSRPWSGHLPLVATIHQPPSHLARSSRRLADLRKQLAQVDQVVALCEDQAMFFQELIGPQRVRLIPHGVDTTFFQPGTEIRRRTVLIVGGWLRDWEMAGRTLIRLLQWDSEVEICLVNPASDHPLLQALPSDRLRITKRLSDEELRYEFQTCGVVYFPFRAATANNALLEACACGCRIVATDIGGVPDYAPSSARLFAHDADAKDVTDMLIEELGCAQSTPINAEAVKRAADFDWTHISTRMFQVYNEAVESSLVSR